MQFVEIHDIARHVGGVKVSLWEKSFLYLSYQVLIYYLFVGSELPPTKEFLASGFAVPIFLALLDRLSLLAAHP